MQKYIHHIKPFLIYALAFTLPLGRVLVVWVMVLLLLAWLIEGNYAEKLKNIAKQPIAIFLILFYGLHVLGLLYTSNQHVGWFDLQVKLPILISALILFGYNTPIADRRYTSYAFLLGCTVSIITSLTSAYISYLSSHSFNEFQYSWLSDKIHPSYMAMYLCFAIGIITAYMYSERGVQKYLLLLSLPIFMAYIVLLSAKSGMLTCGIILIAFLYYIAIVKKNYKATLIYFLCLGSVLALTIGFSNIAVMRIKEALNTFSSGGTIKEESVASTDMRILIWEQAFTIIKENPLLGVGTGDVKDALMDKYQTHNIKGAYDLKLNSHNAFLNSAIAVGVIGGILLLSIIVYLGYLGIRRGDFIMFMLAITLFINFMTEAMLETQAGVIFFSFFICLLAASPPVKQEQQVNQSI